MDDAPPPTDHVLKPHHVALLTIFMLTFKDLESKKLPAPFTLHLYRVLLNEVSEVAQPKSRVELIRELSSGPKAESVESIALIAALSNVHLDLTSAEQMTNFFGNLPSLFVEKDEDEPPILMRRSIFGFFCRRCFVSFLKLSFSGVVKLQKDYQAWCAGNIQAGYEPIQKDQLNNVDLLIFKTQADKKNWAKPEAYEAWEKGQATGDENVATENLRRFFEQHFHDSNDSGVRQHALLNLVRMHYLRHEYAAARKLLSEAITVARTSGDKLTLQHCISMLHRLPPTMPGRKPVLNEIQPNIHPLEVLFDITKLLDEQNDQPLTASFTRIVQAMGLYDHWLDVQVGIPVEVDQWAQHVMQSIVWNAIGSHRLTAIEENVVIAFTEAGGEDNNRITVILNKAYKQARQGEYNLALSMLMEPDVWRGLTLSDYASWAHEIWHILTLRATRRGQDRLYREFLLPRRPSGHFNQREYIFDVKSPVMSKVRDPLYEVMHMRQADQATAVIEQLLTALWHSEFLCRYDNYRTGIILLADVGLEFGMSKRCQRSLEEIMPQIVNGDDLEQRAFAYFVLARCILAAKNPSPVALQEALFYLLKSEADYKIMEIYRSLADVQYLISVVHHNLDQVTERDEAAKRFAATEDEHRKFEIVAVDEEMKQILEVVALIGSALAGR